MHHFGNNFFLSLLIFSLILMITVHTISAANDTITTSQTIRDGETLVSSGGMFQLGFFSLANSSNRYVGICYNNINPKVYVWVANRESPLTTKSGVLTVMEPGILILVNNETNATIWSSTASRTVQNPTVRLLDSGNLVVINDDTPEDILWQSFDNPTDTYLPGMTSLGWNLKTGYPQIVVRRGKTVKFRLGPWNGVRFSGAPGTRNNPTLRMNKDEVKYGEDNVDKSIITRLTLSLEGVGVRWLWNGSSKSWMSYNMEADACDTYGAYGSCGVGDSPICSCMDRFVPRVGERWGRGEWSEGCVARSALNCEDDVFLKYTAIKLPDARNSSYDDRKMMPAECETECLKNCSCTAYKQLDIREETGGCLFYFGDLVDVRSMVAGGDELYIRIASADLENDADSKRRKRVILIASLTPVLVILVLFVMVIWICIWKRKKHSYARAQGGFSGSLGNESELPFFTLSSISKATNSFSMDNKLGEGGFGPVFKGVLENGQEIAVKRLSKTSKQGVDELKNELILIAKLQHRNLVRTL